MAIQAKQWRTQLNDFLIHSHKNSFSLYHISFSGNVFRNRSLHLSRTRVGRGRVKYCMLRDHILVYLYSQIICNIPKKAIM